MIRKVCFFRTEKNAFYANWIGFTNYKSVWTGKKSVFCSPGGRYRIWCLVWWFCIVGCTSQYTMPKWGQISWNEHFCWKGGCTPKDVSTILSKLGHVYMSNFGLAVGCIPHWLPSLDKICKHPIFPGSERYPTWLIYTHLISHYQGHTLNFLNIRTPKKFVVITLKFELCGFTIE